MTTDQISPEEARASLQSINETNVKFHTQLRPSIPKILLLTGLFGIFSYCVTFEGGEGGVARTTIAILIALLLLLIILMIVLSFTNKNKGIKLRMVNSGWINYAIVIGQTVFYTGLHRVGNYLYLNDFWWAPYLTGIVCFAVATLILYKIPFGIWLTEK